MNEKERFIVELYPAALEISKETGMAWQTILAQAAQETGWGQHQLPGTHNIFNIKAGPDWHGSSQTFNVWEIESGRKVWRDQPFRVYDSYKEALLDRVNFLRDNPRYAKAGLFDEGTKGNLEREASALQQAGYATDPHYADGLVRVFNSQTMQRAIRDARALEIAGHPVPNSHSQHAICPHQQASLKRGVHGADVTTLQASLAKLGYTDRHGKPLAVDGTFGTNTRYAVERFQHDHHLKADGIAGPMTWTALDQAQARNTTGPRLDHPTHTDHALFQQAQRGVHQMDAERGRIPDQHSDNLAAALTVQARRNDLTRIDQVALGPDGDRAFAVQHGVLTRHAQVPTAEAVQTSIEQSSAAWLQVMQQRNAAQPVVEPVLQPAMATQGVGR